MKEIYMDYNATTPVREEVMYVLSTVTEESPANASSVHLAGRRAKLHLDEARERVADSLGARTSEIIFTAGGSESDNLAIKGASWARGSGHIITSSVEHPAVLNTCKFLEDRGFEVTYLPVDEEGRVDPDAVWASIRSDTVLVSIMWANNETGVVQPVADIAAAVKEKGVLFHSDAVQAFGKIPVDVRDIPVDMLSLSGHKFYAPKGVGVLYVKRGTVLESLIHGGGQEKGRRSGTENVPAIAALARACELAVSELESESKRYTLLRDAMEERIVSEIEGARINGAGAPRLPNTSSVAFSGVEAEAVLISLDGHGIAVSSASACAAGHTDPSHVLTAMGLSRREAEGTLRFSLGKYSQEEHIDRLLSVLPGVVERLRRLTPGE
jgi:cysteine desulfurase